MQRWTDETFTCLFLPLLLINRSMKLNSFTFFPFLHAVIGATLVLTREDRLNLVTTNYTGRRERTISSGSSLKLHCCLSENTFDRCRVSWHFEPSGKNLTEMNTKNQTLCNETTFAKCNLIDICNSMPCNLRNINESDTGWYYCKVKVEIPKLSELQSYKTKVIGKYCLSLQN